MKTKFMLYGTLGEDSEGSSLIERIYTQFPEGLDTNIYCTESSAPSIWFYDEDWQLYDGESFEDSYYYVNGEYVKLPTDIFEEDIDFPEFYRNIVYKKGKIIKDNYISSNDVTVD